MCEICVHSNIETNVRSYDPTRTTTLRNMFAAKMRSAFVSVRRQVVDALIDKDVFGLNVNVLPGQFAFPTSSKKIEEFMKWLQELIDQDILKLTTIPQIGESMDRRWTDLYIEDSYKRGVLRARQELRKAGADVPSIEQTGGISASMSTPFHLERVGILFIRTFEDLKGISNAMASQISRVLAQGFINGDNPRLIARKLNYVISGMGESLGVTDTLGRFIPAQRRAEILARTEIIRAHHKGMMQEYKNWRLENVYVQAELSTAGDDRVCDICAPLDGKVYTLEEAENLIPLHPLCRCIVIPKL